MRVLTSDDARAFRELRLEGLRLNPESFGADLNDEAKLSEEEFGKRIAPTECAWVLGSFDANDVLRGAMGWSRARGTKRAHQCILWGAYVQFSHRRAGHATALLSRLLKRVDEVPNLRRLQLHVWSENVAAKALYAKFGFRFVALHPESLQVSGRFIDEELWALALPRNV